MYIINKIPPGIYSRLSEIKAEMLFKADRKKGGKTGIFLHSMFRSGSTYIFKKFRENENFWCYYEPFHHQLTHLERENLAVFRFDKVAAQRMNHPHLEKPHFHEYLAAMPKDRLRSFSPVLAYHDFVSVKHHAMTYKYIRNLLNSAPQDRCPVLQFNRSSLRIEWLKRYFSESRHIYLHRPARDQFESYCQAGKQSGGIFLAMNAYIVMVNKDKEIFADLYEKIKDNFTITANLFFDLERISERVGDIPLSLHYEIFLHIWLLSLFHSVKHSDQVIKMWELGGQNEYTGRVVKDISSFRLIDEDMFDDAQLKRYASFSLEDKEFEAVEKRILPQYSGQINQIDEELLKLV